MDILAREIRDIVTAARNRAFTAVNLEMLKAYFEIGKKILEKEQTGKQRAEYGKKIIAKLSIELKGDLGNGFDESNLRRMRHFYRVYRNWETVSPKLTWSHYCELIKISNPEKRGYFEAYAIQEHLGVRDLRRQVSSFHYERLIAKNKECRCTGGLALKNAEGIIKDPYVLEFLELDEQAGYTEQELESRIMDRMQKFLLELGQGFTFVARQKRISIGGSRFSIDLLFYNIPLKCYVAVEIKTSGFKHKDAGQMNLYLNCIKKEMNCPENNPPIGIIMCAERDKVHVEYALSGLSSQMFVSKYMLYLPSKGDMEKEAKKAMAPN